MSSRASASDVAREAIFVRRANDNAGNTGGGRNWYGGRASGSTIGTDPTSEIASGNRTASGGGKWMLRRDRLQDVSGSTIGMENPPGSGGGDEDDGMLRSSNMISAAGGGAVDLRKYADALGGASIETLPDLLWGPSLRKKMYPCPVIVTRCPQSHCLIGCADSIRSYRICRRRRVVIR